MAGMKPCGDNRWPNDVGIISMEVYFPFQFVDQQELEIFDGVSPGKVCPGTLQYFSNMMPCFCVCFAGLCSTQYI